MKRILNFVLILSLYIPTCLADEKITLRYNAFASGIHGFVLDTVIEIKDDNTYSMVSRAKTTGIIGLVYPSVSSYTTYGRIENGNLIIKSYEAIKEVRDKKRINQIFYDDSGIPTIKKNTKNNNTTTTEMEEFKEIAKDAYDYQSMLLALYLNVKNNKSCNSELSIFNGKKRKTLIFKENGSVKLTADSDSIYDGVARECLLTVDEETLQDEDIAWLFTDEGDEHQKPMKVWISEIYDASVPLMVGAELGSIGFGGIYILLESIQIEK